MNVLEAMKKVKKDGRLERKLNTGLTEFKDFYTNGQIKHHYFRNKDGSWHGEYKWWRRDGTLGEHSNYKDGSWHGERKWWRKDGILCEHELWEDDKLIKDYLA